MLDFIKRFIDKALLEILIPASRANPTLKDVAQLAEVSPAIVSTVINQAKGNSLASRATRERVMKAARSLGYRPNYASQSLIRRTTETIGVYVPPAPYAGLGQRYESAVINGIELACQQHGFDLLAINLTGTGDPSVCGHKFAEQRIDGLVLLHVHHDADWIEPLFEHAPNITAVNYYGQAAVDRVNFDDRAAGVLATEHLIGLGHRRIAFVGSRQCDLGPGLALRCEGYCETMAEHGLQVDPRLIWRWTQESDSAPGTGTGAGVGTGIGAQQPVGEPQAHDGPASASRDDNGSAGHDDNGGAAHDDNMAQSKADAAAAVDRFISLGEQCPTALVAYNDVTAAALMRQVQNRGFLVPEQMSIIGMDGDELGTLTWPELTSVAQPFSQMGRLAAERVVRRAGDSWDPDDPDQPKAQSYVKPALIRRQSTAPVIENQPI